MSDYFWLRKIDCVVAWDIVDWLNDDEIQADAFGDLETDENVLSFWKIPNNHQIIDRIIAAIVSRKKILKDIGYALIEDEKIRELKLDIAQKNGTTADSEINGLHMRVSNLTTDKVNMLAKVISKSEIERLTQKELTEKISNSIRQGFLNLTDVSEEIRNKISA
jgi:hypothetical protein